MVFFLADGFHRLAALKKLDRQEVEVEVHRGGKRDALMYALGANARHGLPRNNADKRRCVEIVLRDPEWSTWSTRDIAKQCAVSHNLVAEMKKALELSSDDTSKVRGRDGKSYPKAKAKKSTPVPAPQIDKWPCPKCSTFWPPEVKDCEHCAEPDDAAKKPERSVDEASRGAAAMATEELVTGSASSAAEGCEARARQLRDLESVIERGLAETDAGSVDSTTTTVEFLALTGRVDPMRMFGAIERAIDWASDSDHDLEPFIHRARALVKYIEAKHASACAKEAAQ
jgi:hypothetical protein